MKSFQIKTILVFFIIVGALAVLSFIPMGKYRIFSVQTGSMQPTIGAGSVIIVQAIGDYRINDVITFINPNYSNQTSITHRIVDIGEKDGRVLYVTKGDANEVSDYNKVSEEKIIGKVLFSIPFAGYAVNVARTPVGLAFLIILPALMIILDEAKKIRHEMMGAKKQDLINFNG